MNDIITAARPEEAGRNDTRLATMIAEADDAVLTAAILQAGARLAGRSIDDLETLAMTAKKAIGADAVAAMPALLAFANQIDPVTRVVTEAQAIWTMDWTGRNPDGTRMHPDMPDTEEVFEADRALALLLINEAVSLNSHHWMDAWPKDARATVHLGVNCSDVFAWGCADSEDAVHADLEDVYRHWARDPIWGCAVWSMIRRQQMPQRPVERDIRAAGIWDLDALQAQHGLRANQYDGISGIQAGRKYEAYCAWERASGNEPAPFDATWWEGWRRYVAANPGWEDAAWKAEDERRRLEWRTANGYVEHRPEIAETPPVDMAAEAARLANMAEAAAERRRAAAASTDGVSRSYLLQTAATTEIEILDALPALLSAMGRAVS